MNKNLNDILVFIKVIEAGSFTGAAKSLGVPTSTVSRNVSRLENHLGVTLLHRSTRKLELTPAGRIFHERSERVAEDLQDAEEAVAEMYSRPRGRIRVIAPTDLTFLRAMAIDLLKQYPDVELELELSNRPVDMVSEGFDLSIRVGLPEQTSLIVRRLGESRSYIVASPAYLERAGMPHHVDDLQGRDGIAFQCHEHHVGLQVQGAKGLVPVAIRERLAVNTFEMLHEAVLSGLGLAMVPAFMVEADIEAGRLVHVLPGLEQPSVPLYAVYPSRRAIRPAVRVFLDMLEAQLPEAHTARPPRDSA